MAMSLLKSFKKIRQKDKYFKFMDKTSHVQVENAFLWLLMFRVDKYKLEPALIVKGVSNASNNNVGIDIDTLSISIIKWGIIIC